MKYGFDLDILQSDDMTTAIAKSVENIYVTRQKAIEGAIVGEITRIATENGFDTYIPINENALIEIFKKQIPTKPINKNRICVSKSINGDVSYSYDYHCPMCDEKLRVFEHHCPCGQALDWRDTE